MAGTRTLRFAQDEGYRTSALLLSRQGVWAFSLQDGALATEQGA